MINENRRYFKNFLIKNDIKETIPYFIKHMIAETYFKYTTYRFLYYFLNSIIITLTFCVVIITTLNISKLAFQKPNTGSNIFVFTTAIISSVGAFLSSIVNFFLIKDIYKKNWSYHKRLKFEKNEFDLKVGKYRNNTEKNELLLFENFCKILNFGTRIIKFEEDLSLKGV